MSSEVEKLKSSENPFRSFFEHSPVGMVLLDFNGKLLRSNRALQRMLGRTGEELRGQCLSLFTCPGNSPVYIDQFEALVSKKSDSFEMESRFLRKNGRIGWWRLNMFRVRDPEENLKFIFALIKDVTRWKKSVGELKKAKEEAEEATRTKSEFLANMSHEIRTPIHTITGMTELLLETHLDAEQQEYAEQVRFSADVLFSLINDILDFSKIEAGRLSLEVIDFDLYKTVEDAADLVTLEAHRKGLEVAVFINPQVPHLLRGDPVRLRQVIVNLFNNAVKFTRQGEIIISVERVEDHDNRSTIKFSVRDTGIGISRERLSLLFKSFSQVDSSMTRKYGGTGLGLSISKSLVEAMQGQIGVESEERKGSTFWFTAVLEKQELENIYADVPKDFFGDLGVMVVDDNESSRRVLRRYLEDWGCRIDEVENGPKALQHLRAWKDSGAGYPLALIDLRMPGMDGWQLASEINADKSINNTKLILLTPAGLSGDEAKMKLLKWFDGYLGKPVKRGELLAEIFRVINSDIDLETIEADGLAGPAQELIPELAGLQENLKILVAEDNEVNRQLFRTILEKSGYQVDLANDGREACEAAAKTAYNLIFMDIQMPNMNGYEATEKIRELGIEVPIIAVTANALRDEMSRCLEAGMNDFLAKPFKKKDLLPVMRKWLDLSPQDGAVPEEEEKSYIFDYRKAVDTFMGKEEVVRRVLNLFISKVEEQLKIIQDSLGQDDFERVRAEAHSIKGSAWNLEARQLGDAAKGLEDAGRERQKQSAEYKLSEANEAFALLKRAVSSIIA